MTDMMEYKCPSCGGAMEFDSTTQKMKCPYCDTEMEVAQYQQMQEKAEGNAGGNPGAMPEETMKTGLIWEIINGWKARQTESGSMPVSPVEEKSLQTPIPVQQAVRSVETGLS